MNKSSENDLVTVERYSSVTLAELAKSRLEAEGIDAFVMDSQMSTLNPLYVPALGGVRLQVRQSDLAAAKEILSSVDSTRF